MPGRWGHLVNADMTVGSPTGALAFYTSQRSGSRVSILLTEISKGGNCLVSTMITDTAPTSAGWSISTYANALPHDFRPSSVLYLFF